MILELSKESFTKIRHLVGEVSHYLVLSTLLEGRTPGKVWVNHVDEPTSALLWDKLNTFFFLAGDSTDDKFNQELTSLMMDTLFPEIIQLQYRKFFLQVTSQAWEEQIGVILKGSSPRQQAIYCYALDPRHADSAPKEQRLPTGYKMTRITRELLNDTRLENQDEIVYCIRACWQSVDQYLHNGGVGYCLLEGDVITSWCSTDYVVGNECELYVETFEGHKRKGLGTLAASACVQECVARGLTVYWHCFSDHLGSVKIAEKVGLVKTAECPVYVVDLQDKQHDSQ